MNKFAKLNPEELQEHLSGFLISHWSISSIGAFINNEKAFEKRYIFRDYPKYSSLAAIIGSVYHKALMAFFTNLKETGEIMTFDTLCDISHNILATISATKYRPDAKKTIEKQQLDALKAINSLITNFLGELDCYMNEIQEIVAIEQPLLEFIQINGIDIPLPIKIIPDLLFIDKQGYLGCFDHKSKYTYTPKKDINLRYSNQSIAAILAGNEWIKRQDDILAKYPKAIEGIKKFLYYENKYSKNKDGSRQIKQIPINIAESQQLYEQVLFEGVWRVIEAVQNPDYVYLMNPSDHFEDAEEIVSFWVKTHLEGLEGFPKLKPHQIKILKQKRSAIRRSSLVGIPTNVIKAFSKPKQFLTLTPEQMENITPAQLIEHRLATFNYPIRVHKVIEGYSCDTYLIQVNAGLKVNSIFGYRMDIANALGVPDVRIASSLVAYEGSSFIAVEVNRANANPLFLTNGDVQTSGLKFPLGKDNYGKTLSWDIGNPSTPHLMISGATGSGKSITIQTIIEVANEKGIKVSILDPKNEFGKYSNQHQVISELHEIEKFMAKTVVDMDAIFRNQSGKNDNAKHLIIFDEAADCYARQKTKDYRISFNSKGKQVREVNYDFRTLQENTLILAQKARSAGIHLVLAAQRFSVKVLTGDAKANFTTRLCLKVASGVDSKVMIDQEGAEKLKGRGDALLTSPEQTEPVRIQCFIKQ